MRTILKYHSSDDHLVDLDVGLPQQHLLLQHFVYGQIFRLVPLLPVVHCCLVASVLHCSLVADLPHQSIFPSSRLKIPKVEHLSRIFLKAIVVGSEPLENDDEVAWELCDFDIE